MLKGGTRGRPGRRDVLDSRNAKGKGPKVGIDLTRPDLWVHAKRQMLGLQQCEPRGQGQRWTQPRGGPTWPAGPQRGGRTSFSVLGDAVRWL